MHGTSGVQCSACADYVMDVRGAMGGDCQQSLPGGVVVGVCRLFYRHPCLLYEVQMDVKQPACADFLTGIHACCMKCRRMLGTAHVGSIEVD
eukprot:1156182-Pelagomonas_calceolata.AAC.7